MKKSGNFGTIGSKRRGIQKKNPFSFGIKILKTVGFIHKSESMCGVKAFISKSQAPRGTRACRMCGLFHADVGSKSRIDAMGVNLTQAHGVDGGVVCA